jgi:hypothetical protein
MFSVWLFIPISSHQTSTRILHFYHTFNMPRPPRDIFEITIRQYLNCVRLWGYAFRNWRFNSSDQVILSQGTRHESRGSTLSRPEHQMEATVFRTALRRNRSVKIHTECICGYAS